MGTKPVIPYTTNHARGGGALKVAERSGRTATSVKYGYRDLGNSLSVTLSRSVDTIQIKEGRSGDFNVVQEDAVNPVNKIVVEARDMTIRTFAMFFGLDYEERSVTADPVTNEELHRPFAGATYPIGSITDFPEGLLTIASVQALDIKGGTWAATTEYDVGDVVIVAGSPAQAHICTVAGTSAGSEPSWASAGGTVADNDITWRHLGDESLTVDVDYAVDLADSPEIGILPTGTFATTVLGRVPSGYYLTLQLDYTPVAHSVMRLKPLSAAKTYALQGIGQMNTGQPAHFNAEFCSVIGTGDSQWINESDPQTMTLEFTALDVIPEQPAIQIRQAPLSQF